MLNGERVVLRPIERGDLPRLLELRSDAELERLVWGAPYPHTLEELEAAFDRNAEKAPPERDAVEFGIDVDGTLIGRITMFFFDRVGQTCRMGISIERSMTGKGYGRDAIATLVRYAFEDLNLHRISIDTLATNEAAMHAFAACGFVEEGRLRQHYWYRGRYVDAVDMGILRSEWLAERPERSALTPWDA
jgi:RimJ/RimL family protein N-acetyltransferase